MTTALVILDDRAIQRDTLLDNASRAASGLHALGVREGDTIALLLRNDFAFFEAQQAASLLGVYCVPINWHGKPDEVLYVLNDARPKVLVAHSDLLLPLRGKLPDGMHTIGVPTPPEILHRYGLPLGSADCDAEIPRWPDWLATWQPWDGPPVRTRASMIYTSGTTGHPKAVRRDPSTPEQTAGYADMTSRVFGVRPGMRALIAGPLYHASPNAFGRHGLPVAELLVLQSKFDAEQTLALIEQHRLTHAVMVPTMFARLLKLPAQVRSRYDVSSIRWVTHTGAPCPVDIKRELMAWWGPVVYETYGGTEVGTLTLATPDDAASHPGSVGRPTPGAQIAFYGESGQRLQEGEIGEIYARVPWYADFTYLNHPEKRRSVERDGLVSLGDIGYMKDGYVYLCDRRADMVIIAGTNIYPAEIEMVLMQCPGVQDCAVFGIPDDDLGEALAAAVEPMPGVSLTAQQIQDWLRARLASIKVPRQIDFHPRLPRQDSGKIFKRLLRDPYWANAGRSI
ncbi:MAG: acyl-CoA synthetase [Burkholderiales bacterium]